MSKRLISVLLFTILSLGGVPALSSGYLPQRERKVVPTPAPQATPVPTAGPSPVQTPSASPSPASTSPRLATTTKSLAELRTRIAEIVRKPELARAMVAVKIASLDTGRVLFEENAHKLVRPASNMKLYTIATALDRLSPDFRFTTSVQSSARPDSDGTIRGDLTIYGRGDPSIAARFNSGDYYKGIDDLATRIAAAGVKRVEGDLVGDESYFTGPQVGSGWEWEDLTWYFGAEVSPLTVNDNALDLFIKPGARVGASALVTTGPIDPLLVTVNRTVTAAKGTRRNLTIYRGLGENILEISGTIPMDDKGYTGGIAISHPAQLFIQMLRAALAQHGVTVTGKSRTTDGKPELSIIPSPANAAVQTSGPRVEITNMQSPPLSVVAAQTLKPSQNLYAELVLRTLGKNSAAADANTDSESTSEDAGLEVVKLFLKDAGVSPDALVLSDGSGLSRSDMVTAEGTVQLLTYMSMQKYATVWRDALPIAGVDGTLRNRMKGTVAENNLRAKTGSLSSAASLSGYVTSASGENLVFSIMVNNYPRDAEPRAVCIDPIAVLLASFTGRS
ncbi:MAG: D-alanyl-D-alanine carboxypeptidase/D-alanyl-D-alanine-endopeptidase [Acidobacteriota bacterium]|nr:D-alanyl-D-alanine carboxypeptidase/D-alanyl-D-alanine-endopeptidase [Acidobacteriota bacterium]